MIYIIKVWKFIKGYVIIKITGFNINKFINKAADSNIEIFNLHNFNNRYYQCCIHISKYNSLNELAKKYNCNINIISKNIISVINDNIKCKFIFIIGIFYFIFMLYICSSLVWIIDIEGNSQISDSEIYKFCNENNLYIGCPISTVDGKVLSENIRNVYKNISWINFSTEGTRVYIKLAEGQERSINISDSEPCDIVADVNGIITDIITDKGTPCVKKNDIVVVGDVLISGTIVNSGNEEIIINDIVHSIGTIRANVTKFYNFTVPLKQTKKNYTGNTVNKYRIKLWQLDFADNEEIKYNNYDFSKSVNQLKLGENIYLPITFFKYVYREYNNNEEIITVEAAKNIANKQVRNYIIENYPASADILSCNIDYNIKNNILNVKATILSNEEIGVKQKIEQLGGNLLNDTTETANS